MKAVFFDRDGTLIAEPPGERLVEEEHIELFPDTISALQLLAKANIGIVIITNQAGISEDLITEDAFQALHDKVLSKLLESDVTILGTQLCPHAPNDNCECRKPKPKMILEAAEEFDINLADSFMVGDRLSDLEAGKNAGTKSILVKTGNAVVQTGYADYDANNLLEAVEYIVAQQSDTI